MVEIVEEGGGQGVRKNNGRDGRGGRREEGRESREVTMGEGEGWG